MSEIRGTYSLAELMQRWAEASGTDPEGMKIRNVVVVSGPEMIRAQTRITALEARIEVLEAELSRQSELLRRWMIAFDTEIVVVTDQEMTIEIGREFGNLVAETKKELYQIAKKAESALKGEVQK